MKRKSVHRKLVAATYEKHPNNTKMIEKGEKPPVFIRDQPGFKERGAKKFYYTYQDIAKLLGIKVNTVQHLVSSKKLDPNSLKSIFEQAILRRKEDTND